MRGRLLIIITGIALFVGACEQPIVLSDWDDPATFTGRTFEFENDTTPRVRVLSNILVTSSPLTGSGVSDSAGMWSVTITGRQQDVLFTLTAPGYDTAYCSSAWWNGGLTHDFGLIVMTRPITDAPPALRATLDTTSVGGDTVILRVTATSAVRASMMSIILTPTPTAPRDSIITNALVGDMLFRLPSSMCDGRPLIYTNRVSLRALGQVALYCVGAYGFLQIDRVPDNEMYFRGIGPFSPATVVE